MISGHWYPVAPTYHHHHHHQSTTWVPASVLCTTQPHVAHCGLSGRELEDEIKKQEAEIAGNQRDAAMKAPLSKRWVEVCGLRLWPYYKYMYDPDEQGYLGDK